MEKPVDWKFTLPAALKARIFAVAKHLSIPAASVVRLALTEFAQKQEQSK